MKVYRSKLDWIAPQVCGKEVLDLGCVCHDLEQTAVPWLHDFLRQRATSVLGVDYLDEPVARLKERGYDVVAADVQTMELGRSFDVIVAGDIVEHLDNVGAFLDRCIAHLRDNGRLLVTTPNPVNPVRLMRTLIKGDPGGNREHTCWFTAKVFRQLAERHGLSVVDEAYADDARLFYPWLKPIPNRSPVRRFFRGINRLAAMALVWKPILLVAGGLARLRPRSTETLCVALQKTSTVGGA